MNKEFAIVDSLKNTDIRNFRKNNKLARLELAFLVGVSIKTIENWEITNKSITGPIVTLLTILNEKPELIDKYRLPIKEYPLRMFYMSGYSINTVIDVDMIRSKVKFKNYTSNILLRAFGNKEEVSYIDFEKFLESRCFPSTRDKMKIELDSLNLKAYDPLSIIRKTKGRMVDDECYIVIDEVIND